MSGRDRLAIFRYRKAKNPECEACAKCAWAFKPTMYCRFLLATVEPDHTCDRFAVGLTDRRPGKCKK